MNYKYILFDLDGTLTNPQEGITKSIQYALKHFGIEESDQNKLNRFIGPPLLNAFMEYYNMKEFESKAAIAKYRERFSEVGIYENFVYDGIPLLLKQLKNEGKILAVATSKPKVFADLIVKKFDLEKYFDLIVGSELDGRRSDKAEVIKEVLSMLKLKEADLHAVVMVGDRKHDIIGAKKLNISSVGVKYGFAEDGELEDAGADYIADTVTALFDIL